MSEAIKLHFENRVRDGSHAAVLVRVNVKPKLGTVSPTARRFDHEFALRTRLTLVACHRPALAGTMFIDLAAFQIDCISAYPAEMRFVELGLFHLATSLDVRDRLQVESQEPD